MRNGPIMILEDDVDDQEIICEALKDIRVQNELLIFNNGVPALEYLLHTKDKPFIILSDINLPVMNGMEFRKQININEFLRKKSIPFIFFSTAASSDTVNTAYDMSVQGFFIKASSYSEIRDNLSIIVAYWGRCRHPNSDR